jgi:hypothetical protein
VPLLIAEQRTQAWLDAHLRRITSSTAAGCLGLDPNNGPFATFREITGRHKKKVTSDMQWGIDREAECMSMYEIETGNLVVPTGFWVHASLPWLGASPDGLIGDDGMFEMKNPGVLPKVIPVKHQIQMTIQMSVCRRRWCDYYCLDREKRSLLIRYCYDMAYAVKLIAQLQDFNERYIVPDICPPRRRVKNAKTTEAADPRPEDAGGVPQDPLPPGGNGSCTGTPVQGALIGHAHPGHQGFGTGAVHLGRTDPLLAPNPSVV